MLLLSQLVSDSNMTWGRLLVASGIKTRNPNLQYGLGFLVLCEAENGLFNRHSITHGKEQVRLIC